MNCSSAARAALLLLMAAAAAADEGFSPPIVDKIRKLLRDGSEEAIDESSPEHGKAQSFEEGGPKALYFMGIPLAADEVSGAAKAEGEKEEQEDVSEPAAVDGIEVSQEDETTVTTPADKEVTLGGEEGEGEEEGARWEEGTSCSPNNLSCSLDAQCCSKICYLYNGEFGYCQCLPSGTRLWHWDQLPCSGRNGSCCSGKCRPVGPADYCI